MFLSFGEVKKNWILFIIVPILYSLRQFIESKVKSSTKNLFFSEFIRFFARSLNIFLWILLEKKTALTKKIAKKEEEEEINNKNQFLLINQEESINSQVDNSTNSFSQFDIEKEKDRKKKEELLKSSKNFQLNTIKLYSL